MQDIVVTMDTKKTGEISWDDFREAMLQNSSENDAGLSFRSV
jgi:hypothetical protein